MKLKIGFSVKFKRAKFPSQKNLIGKYCFLEPAYSKKHSKDLFDILKFEDKINNFTDSQYKSSQNSKNLKILLLSLHHSKIRALGFIYFKKF